MALVGATEQAEAFLTGIHRVKPRYVRDQFNLLQKIAIENPVEIIEEAIAYCLERNLYSAVDCRDVALWLNKQTIDEQADDSITKPPDWFKVKTEKRNIASAYAHLAGGRV